MARLTSLNAALMVINDETLKDRFKRLFEEGAPDKCWEWRGTFRKVDGQNYGWIATKRSDYGRTNICTSRLALFFKTHILPLDKIACHTCDNPKCVNPNHLYWGTDADNMADVKARHRRLYKTNTERAEIKKAALLANQAELKELAVKHKMSFGMIIAVKYGRTWKGIKADA